MNTKISSKEACTLAHQIRRETGCSLADAFKAAYNRNAVSIDTKTSWTAEEVNKIFSDKAAELLRKGYIIDLSGMSGSQGEIGKIIYKKDNVFYALVMENKSSRFDGKYTDHYVIWFGKYTENTSHMRPLDHWNTLWINRFEASWSLEFVKITDNYFVTVEEAKTINQKWIKRCSISETKYEQVDSKYKPAILTLVRKQKGYKGTKVDDIVKITRVIPYNGKRYYRVTINKANKNVDVRITF